MRNQIYKENQHKNNSNQLSPKSELQQKANEHTKNSPLNSLQKKADTFATHSSIQETQMKSEDKSTKTHLPAEVQTKMESSFETDFSNVNIHQDSSSASNMGALAYAQGNDVHFASGQYHPNSEKGQELLGHELTHVVQQRQGRVQGVQSKGATNVNDDPSLENEADIQGARAAKGEKAVVKGTGNGVQLSSGLDKLSDKEKKKAKISRSSISGGSSVKELFSNKASGYGVSPTISDNATFVGVNEDMKKPLMVYIGERFSSINTSTSVTRLLDFKNSAIDGLATYSEASQGKLKKAMAYRFTSYFEDETGDFKIVIEELGEVKSTTPSAEEVKTSKERFDKYFTFTTDKSNPTYKSFTASEKEQVYSAVALLPDNVLSRIKGVKFYRSKSTPTTKEAGEYDPNTHSIILYDNVFEKNDTIFGNLKDGFHTAAQQLTLHEIGHAVDEAQMFKLSEKYRKLSSAYNAIADKWNKKQIDDATFQKAKAKMEKAEADYLALTTPTGQAMEVQGNMIDVSSSTYQTDYTKAVNADGPKGYTMITDYAHNHEKPFVENFAESFALFYVDQDRYKKLRPNQGAYFQKQGYLSK